MTTTTPPPPPKAKVGFGVGAPRMLLESPPPPSSASAVVAAPGHARAAIMSLPSNLSLKGGSGGTPRKSAPLASAATAAFSSPRVAHSPLQATEMRQQPAAVAARQHRLSVPASRASGSSSGDATGRRWGETAPPSSGSSSGDATGRRWGETAPPSSVPSQPSRHILSPKGAGVSAAAAEAESSPCPSSSSSSQWEPVFTGAWLGCQCVLALPARVVGADVCAALFPLCVQTSCRVLLQLLRRRWLTPALVAAQTTLLPLLPRVLLLLEMTAPLLPPPPPPCSCLRPTCAASSHTLHLFRYASCSTTHTRAHTHAHTHNHRHCCACNTHLRVLLGDFFFSLLLPAAGRCASTAGRAR
jgi:hypothetical protein